MKKKRNEKNEKEKKSKDALGGESFFKGNRLLRSDLLQKIHGYTQRWQVYVRHRILAIVVVYTIGQNMVLAEVA